MIAVCNTSPVSNLIQIAALPLLATQFSEVCLPPEVAAELDDGADLLGDWRAAPGATGLETRPAPTGRSFANYRRRYMPAKRRLSPWPRKSPALSWLSMKVTDAWQQPGSGSASRAQLGCSSRPSGQATCQRWRRCLTRCVRGPAFGSMTRLCGEPWRWPGRKPDIAPPRRTAARPAPAVYRLTNDATEEIARTFHASVRSSPIPHRSSRPRFTCPDRCCGGSPKSPHCCVVVNRDSSMASPPPAAAVASSHPGDPTVVSSNGLALICDLEPTC